MERGKGKSSSIMVNVQDLPQLPVTFTSMYNTFAYSIGEGSGMGRSGGGIPDQKDGGAAGRGRVFAGIRFLVEVRG